MLTGDIITTYTDQQYLSKNDLVMALGTSLIDPFWIKIEEYRRANAIYLDLTSISRIPFSITMTPSISKKIGDVSNGKLEQLNLEFHALSVHPILKAQLERQLTFSSMKANNDIERLALSDVAIKAVIAHNNEGNNPGEVSLSHYLDALDYVKEHYMEEIDEDYLAAIWGRLLGESELTEFYRCQDSISQYSMVLVNRDDFEAPSREIENMMDHLFRFIAGDSCNGFQKALAALYYIFYVKPFSRHNEAVASIIAKSILLREDYGEACLYLPLESLLKANFPKFKPTFLNVQRYNDLTYFILNSLGYIDSSIEAMISSINKEKSKMMDEEREVVTPSDLGLAPAEEEKTSPVIEDEKEETSEPNETPFEVIQSSPNEENEEEIETEEKALVPNIEEKEENELREEQDEEILHLEETPSIQIENEAPEAKVEETSIEEEKPEETFHEEQAGPKDDSQAIEENNEFLATEENNEIPTVEENEPVKEAEETSLPEENQTDQIITEESQPIEEITEQPEAEEIAEQPETEEITEQPETEEITEQPETEETPEQPRLEEIPAPNENENRVAYSKTEHPYSDKEMREYARYLLETHPNLRRHQAYFYSCHATIGRYYTIQDYKRYAKCVYETARTSMENLVKEGFYKKIQVRNKFVYTPIEGEKK